MRSSVRLRDLPFRQVAPRFPIPKREDFGFVTHTHAVFRNSLASVSSAQWPLRFLCASSFSRDPLADVGWAILEGDAVRFATPKKIDGVLIHEG